MVRALHHIQFLYDDLLLPQSLMLQPHYDDLHLLFYLNQHSSFSSHVYPGWHGYLGRCGRRVLQGGTKAWFTSQTRWAVCVGHACMSVACVSLIFAFHVLVAFASWLIMVVVWLSWGIWYWCREMYLSWVCDWLHMVICHLDVDYMSPTYILVC